MLTSNENHQKRIYACGLTLLICALKIACAYLPVGARNIEPFQNTNISNGFDGKENNSFEVEPRKRGRIVHVPAQCSLLQILNENGCRIMCTCTKGTCGTCEVAVIDGKVDHRDTVLTEKEKQEGESLIICMSRSKSEILLLDL